MVLYRFFFFNKFLNESSVGVDARKQKAVNSMFKIQSILKNLWSLTSTWEEPRCEVFQVNTAVFVLWDAV